MVHWERTRFQHREWPNSTFNNYLSIDQAGRYPSVECIETASYLKDLVNKVEPIHDNRTHKGID